MAKFKKKKSKPTPGSEDSKKESVKEEPTNIGPETEKTEPVSENSSTEFENIRIKTNMPRCYILIWTQKELIAKISPWSTKKECCQKTPGVLLHNDLMTCIDHQCIKTSYKITVLHGISACMNTNEKTLVTKAFINSQFDHSILIRMSHIWKLNIPYMGLTKQRMTNNKIKTEAKCNIF